MTKFLEAIQRYASAPSASEVFRGEGVNLTRGSGARMSNPRYQKALVRFQEAYAEMIGGSRPASRFMQDLMEGQPGAYAVLGEGLTQGYSFPGQPAVLREALSTSDFPLLFGDTIDRLLLAKYKVHEPTWQNYMRVSRVKDFRTAKRFKCSIGRGILPAVGEGESYDDDKPGELSYSFSVSKYGQVRNIFWESLVNDDLQALQDAPEDFALQARNTEAYVATGLFAANTTLYATTHTAEDGNTYSNKGTDQFDAEALASAISAMGNFPGDDVDGTPIMNDPVHIVVGTRELHLKVEQVLNSLIVAYTGGSDVGNLPTANIISQELRSRMKAWYNPFLRMLDTNYQTGWYLFAEPSDGWAAEFAYLQGYDAPQLFMRATSQVLLGGGLASPMEGGFDNDSVDYKVRHVMGGSHTNAVGGWRFSYYSDGTGS